MILHRILKFLRETGMPATQFGRLAVSDPRFVADLRKGREPRPRTAARVDGFINGFAVGSAAKFKSHDTDRKKEGTAHAR